MLMNKYHLIRLVYKWHSPEMNLIHWNWMVRNGNGLHTKRMEWRLFLLILVKCVTCFGFLTLHSKHNIRAMSVEKTILHSRRNRLTKKASQWLAFIHILFFGVIRMNLIISDNILAFLYISSFNQCLLFHVLSS